MSPTKADILGEKGARLAEKAKQKKKEKDQAHQEFLETVSEEDGAEELETTCNLAGEWVVPVSAKLDGSLMDRLGEIDKRLERLETDEARAYEISDAAEDASNLLADLIDEKEYHAGKFLDVYEQEGLNPLGVMIQRVFDALKAERERKQGAADGFRKK